MKMDEVTGRPRSEIEKEFDLMNREIDKRDAPRIEALARAHSNAVFDNLISRFKR